MAAIDITNQQLLDALTQQLDTISDNMAVRKDVEEIVGEVVEGVVGEVVEGVVGNIVEKSIQKAIKPLATKDELKSLATKDDLSQAVARLERKISSSHTVNIKHHLETRAAIGNLNKDLASMREGLAQAVNLT